MTEEYRQSIVTTAPPDYDGFGTAHVANCGYYGNDRVRMVSILQQYYDWQVERYWSGNYWVRTFAEWCDMQKRGGE